MNFTPDMFLLPDGKPMDASEIADMMNNWMGKKPEVSTSKSDKWGIKGYTKVPYYKSSVASFSSDGPYEFGLPSPSVIAMDIPTYNVDFLNILDDICVKHAMEHSDLTYIIVGYDVYFNIKDQLDAKSRYSYSNNPWGEPSQGSANLTFIGATGPITILCSNNYQEITPVYTTPNLRMLNG